MLLSPALYRIKQVTLSVFPGNTNFIQSNPIQSNPNPMKLESKIKSLLSHFPTNSTFRVQALELFHDGEGWSVNNGFIIANNASLETVLESARGRWEVFKVNYFPKARVRDITDFGDSDPFDSAMLECNGVPLLEIRTCEEVK
jgi:hypothetical protein